MKIFWLASGAIVMCAAVYLTIGFAPTELEHVKIITGMFAVALIVATLIVPLFWRWGRK